MGQGSDGTPSSAHDEIGRRPARRHTAGPGKLTLQRERLDFVSLVRSVLDAHTMEFHSGGRKLNFEVLNQPIWVIADSTRLSQVVENLLENAKKFTDPGGDINVRVRENRETGSAEMSMRDTGIGIAPELLPRVFDLFEQAEHSLARSRGGLGVGLALVKKLIEMHGGEVRAASTGLGQGAEFVFWIPLAQAPTGPPRVAAGSGRRTRFENPHHRRQSRCGRHFANAVEGTWPSGRHRPHGIGRS